MRKIIMLIMFVCNDHLALSRQAELLMINSSRQTSCAVVDRLALSMLTVLLFMIGLLLLGY